MINQVIIDNFATIEHISFELGPTLNIITGETGAGKSVLIEAISTALGGRADISMVRTGTDRSRIQIAGEKDSEEVIITREILASGKSLSKINGELVSLAQLKKFCEGWIDIHGQYDNQMILNSDNHITITDSFHNELIAGELEVLQSYYDEYKQAEKSYNTLLREESEAKKQKDYLEYEFNYISSLNLMPHEDEELREELDIMRNSEKIYSSVSASYSVLHENENAILSQLNYCMNELSQVSEYSELLGMLSSQIQDNYYQLEDVSDKLRDISNSLSYDESDLDKVSERLSAIEDAKRKYGKDIDGIIEYMNSIDAKLNLIQNFDYEKAQLLKSKEKAYELLEKQADHVSEIRHVIAERLERLISSELIKLDFANSEFHIDIKRSDVIGPNGYDEIEFTISTNPGEPLMPLAKIASGGEISRIMLAFKHIIGDCDSVETMIFDEIDTGISGRTALTVGKELKEISETHQIICITHLPQIAAYGNDNYLISKEISDDKSHTVINHLDDEGKIKMVATLFSGDDSDNAVLAAKDIIEKAGMTVQHSVKHMQ